MPLACLAAIMVCPFGAAPAPLIVVPKSRVFANNKPVANIADVIPMVEVTSCGTCMSPANPITAALTAAALGVLVPGVCLPSPIPLVPIKPMVLVGGMPAAYGGALALCTFGMGPMVIGFTGQMVVI